MAKGIGNIRQSNLDIRVKCSILVLVKDININLYIEIDDNKHPRGRVKIRVNNS